MFSMHVRGCGPKGRFDFDSESMRRDIHDAMRAMHGFPGGGGGGRRGRMFDGDELRLVMLKLIADEPRHGYDLIREIETMTGGGYAPSPGVIYPSLTMLGEMGMIDEEASAGVKKRFAATAEGRAHLAENADQVAGLIAKLSGMGDRAKRGDRAPVRRALGNLRHVVQDRLMYGDLSDEQVHDVAAMIDELVQRIERLK
ncbi:PadR family transcriptional regulator [Sphingomonas oligophenolica]|nr:PadR family transcriptional regulator [Sphingomonas oligophenolica]